MKNPKDGKKTIERTTPAQARKAVRKLAKVRGCSAAQVLADERKAHARASGRGKLYHADIMGKGVVTDRSKLDAKYGRAATECLAQMYAAELQREQEAHAQTAAEAVADVATLAQQVATAQMWQRYERRKRRKVEQGLTFVAMQAAAAQAAAQAEQSELYAMKEAWEEMQRRCGKGMKISRRTFYTYVKEGRFGIVRVKRTGMHPVYRFEPQET